MSQLSTARVHVALGLIVALGFSVLSAWTAFTSPLAGFDSAYNLQVTESLRTNFIYSSKYHPLILNPEITTNGLVQYLTAIFINVLGERIGLSVALGLFSFTMLASVLMYSRTAFLFVSLLFMGWRMMFQLSTQFLGEIFSLAMLILMVSVLKRIGADSSTKIKQETMIALAGIFLALAAQTKLLAGVVGLLIVFGLLIRPKELGKKSINASSKTFLKLAGWASFSFVGFYVFSYTHSVIFASMQSIEVDSSNLLMFVLQHIYQGVVQGAQPQVPFDYLESAVVMISMLITASSLLLNRSWSWLPLVLIAFSYMFTSGANERRVFLFIAVIFILAVGEAKFKRSQSGLVLVRRDWRTKSIEKFLLLTLFVLVFLQLIFSTYGKSGPISMFSANFDRVEKLSYSLGQKYLVPNEYQEIVRLIGDAPGPILTSGWYQFPEIQLWSGKVFFDRMDSGTPDLLGPHQRMFLLFSPKILAWPTTPMELCGEVIYSSIDLTFCEFNSEFPLSHQG
jgi:hypothetical protein